MKLVYLGLFLYSCSLFSLKIVKLYNYKQQKEAYIHGREHIDPVVLDFRNRLLKFNTSELENLFITNSSCSDITNTKKDIYLSINKNVFVLNHFYKTKEQVEEFYLNKAEIARIQKEDQEHEEKMQKIQQNYHKVETCKSNINLLQKENKSWHQFFRESYEYFPEIKEFEYKKDILIAVIDTGITFVDPILSDAIPTEYKYNLKKLNFSESTDFDSHGHGTHVAGIILGVMPTAKLLPLKFYNPKMSGEKNIKAGLDSLQYAIDQNVDIVNYSGGGPEFDQREYNLLKKAQAKGILVVAAAGNENENIDNPKTSYYPAAYNLDNIVVIGNSKTNWAKEDKGFQKVKNSNYGKKNVDFFMKGYRVKSLVGFGDKCGMGYLSGTSMSTPVFTGLVASLKSQYPELSYKEIIGHLKRIAHKVDRNSRYGYLELSPSLNTPINPSVREIASKSNVKIQ